MAITANGKDHVARVLGGDDVGRTGTGAGVSYTATSMTDTGASFTASSGGPPQNGGLVGHYIVSGSVYGVIVNNTTTVATVDYWHNATAPDTVGTTPSANATYIILAGSGPCWYMGLTDGVNGTVGSNSFLTNNGTTIAEFWASGAALNRKRSTYAHTNDTSTYTLTFTATANANDGTRTVNRIGLFANGVTAAPTTTTSGVMLFETAVTSPPTLVNGDSITITDTVNSFVIGCLATGKVFVMLPGYKKARLRAPVEGGTSDGVIGRRLSDLISEVTVGGKGQQLHRSGSRGATPRSAMSTPGRADAVRIPRRA